MDTDDKDVFDNKDLIDRYVKYYLKEKNRDPENQPDLLALLAAPPPKIKFASWVPLQTREVLLTNRTITIPFIKKWLETGTPDAEKAWNSLFSRFCQLEDTEQFIQEQRNFFEARLKRNPEFATYHYSEFDDQVEHFLSVIGDIVIKCDTPIHQTVKIPNQEKQSKISRLQATLRKAEFLYRELQIEEDNLIFFEYPKRLDTLALDLESRVRNSLESKIGYELGQVLQKYFPDQRATYLKAMSELRNATREIDGYSEALHITIKAMDLKITDILQSQYKKLEQLKSIPSVPSPNSESARLIHFSKNWTVLMYYWFGEPLWATSATIASILLEETVTNEQVRDICRKADGGKFITNLKTRFSREN